MHSIPDREWPAIPEPIGSAGRPGLHQRDQGQEEAGFVSLLSHPKSQQVEQSKVRDGKC